MSELLISGRSENRTRMKEKRNEQAEKSSKVVDKWWTRERD
jgi:hypothetical protein